MTNLYNNVFNKGVTVYAILFPFFSAHAATESAPPTAEPVSVSSILQVFLWLVIVVLIIVLLTWMLKKISGVNTNLTGTIKIVSGVHVGQREKIALVQVGDKQILVGITPSTITKLHVMEENVEILNPRQTPTANFSEKLKQAITTGKYNK
jgi:flagellar protein FliO/FliZ